MTCARCGGEVADGAPRCACGYPASPAAAAGRAKRPPAAPPPLPDVAPAPAVPLAQALGFDDDAPPAPAGAEASFEDLDLGGDPEPPSPTAATPAVAERARYRGPAAGPAFARVTPRRGAAPVLGGIAALCLAAVVAFVWQARKLERAAPAPDAAPPAAGPPAAPALAAGPSTGSGRADAPPLEPAALAVAPVPAPAVAARTLPPAVAAPSAEPPPARARLARAAREQPSPAPAPRPPAGRAPERAAGGVEDPAPSRGAGSVGPATVVSLDHAGADRGAWADVPLPPPPAGATPVEDAPRYAAAGFRKPNLQVPRCVQDAIRLPRDARERVSGPVTVRFAVAKDGTVGLFQVMGDLPDRRVADAIWTAVRGCRFAPGADAAGKPTRLWVVMPIRFDE
ncbi:TonB family protein [Anaeromyxobacter dehalogenans]|uniref:TonB family protein n=1 Tax=Anaeromyxobacter dehalogenans TaxID=161493 RepID=UPI0002D7D8FB|nr:TonB family protein [Anaeromyxobacter dehalogenans]